MTGQVMGKTDNLAGTEPPWDQHSTGLLGCDVSVITVMTSSVLAW